MAYSTERCFDEHNLFEAKIWLHNEYDVEAGILYLAVEEELEQKEVIKESEIEEWQDYLRDKFNEKELEDLAGKTFRYVNQAF